MGNHTNKKGKEFRRVGKEPKEEKLFKTIGQENSARVVRKKRRKKKEGKKEGGGKRRYCGVAKT